MSIFTTHFRTFSRNKYWVLLVQAIQSDFELFLEIIQNITVKIVLGHKVFLQLKLGLTVIGHNGSTVLTYFCLVGLGSERTFQFVRNAYLIFRWQLFFVKAVKDLQISWRNIIQSFDLISRHVYPSQKDDHIWHHSTSGGFPGTNTRYYQNEKYCYCHIT